MQEACYMISWTTVFAAALPPHSSWALPDFHLYNGRMFFHEDWSPSTPFHFPLSLPCPDLLPSDPHPFVLYPRPPSPVCPYPEPLSPHNSFHPLDHVAMCLLAPTYPHLALLCLMDPGGKLPSNLPVPGSPHCGLHWPRADPSTRWDPPGCAEAFAGRQLDFPHPLGLPSSVQWLGLPGPPEQFPLPHRTGDSQHLFQAGLPGPGQQQSDWNTQGDIWGVKEPDQTTIGQQPLSEHGEWGGFPWAHLSERTGTGAQCPVHTKGGGTESVALPAGGEARGQPLGVQLQLCQPVRMADGEQSQASKR